MQCCFQCPGFHHRPVQHGCPKMQCRQNLCPGTKRLTLTRSRFDKWWHVLKHTRSWISFALKRPFNGCQHLDINSSDASSLIVFCMFSMFVLCFDLLRFWRISPPNPCRAIFAASKDLAEQKGWSFVWRSSPGVPGKVRMVRMLGIEIDPKSIEGKDSDLLLLRYLLRALSLFVWSIWVDHRSNA